MSAATMGNIYGFRFSAIIRFIPNACFQTLRDMGRCACRRRGRGSKTATDAKVPRRPVPHLESGRESYYISSRGPAVVCGGQCFSRRTAPETSKVRTCRRDFNIDNASEYCVPVLPPIVTKSSKAKLKEPGPTSTTSSRGRRRSSLVEIHHRQRNRVNYTSPRMQVVTRKKLRSIVVVKTSVDPQTEFRDSMVEMIVENKITSHHDLEELLACYLSLNSNELHDVIVKAFRQIWLRLNR